MLLIIFVLIAVTTRLLNGHNMMINRHSNTFEHNQALQYLLGAESMAKEALHSDFITTGANVDHLKEMWAEEIMPFELDEGGYLEAHVRDLNSCVNLNNVLSETGGDEYKTIKRLLINVGLPTEIEDLWRDWVDQDIEVAGLGAEDNEYASGQYPYRTPNRLVTDFSEILLLRDMSFKHLTILKKEACLIPETNSQINVNTASIEVLRALGEDMSLSMAENLTQSVRAFKTPAEFLEAYPQLQKSRNNISTKSTYFEMHAQAKVGKTIVSMLSRIYRNPEDGRVSVLRRDFGRLFRSKIRLETETQEI